MDIGSEFFVGTAIGFLFGILFVGVINYFTAASFCADCMDRPVASTRGAPPRLG